MRCPEQSNSQRQKIEWEWLGGERWGVGVQWGRLAVLQDENLWRKLHNSVKVFNATEPYI